MLTLAVDEGDTVDGTVARNDTLDANRLCEACVYSFDNLFEFLKGPLKDTLFEVDHQYTVEDLRFYATEEKCPLCQLFWKLFGARVQELEEDGCAEGFTIRFVIEEMDTVVSPVEKAVVHFEYWLCINAGENSEEGGMIKEGSFEISCESECIPFFPGREVAENTPLELGQKWMNTCSNCHKGCTPIQEQLLPTRLIDVGKPGDEHILRLIETTKGQKDRYVALSHCWGTRKFPLITLRSNIVKLFQHIPHEDLVKNFQDAIYVTRQYGYRYLWIDSLCIIQDDLRDWERECMKMQAVYANAAFTIAAVGAPNGSVGFLRPREAQQREFCDFMISADHQLPLAKVYVTLVEDILGPGLLSRQDPPVLDKRAWGMQERLLSPRVLSFGTHQMYFECDSVECYERSYFPRVPLRTSNGVIMNPWHISVRRPWLLTPGGSEVGLTDHYSALTRDYYDIASYYSSCLITKARDKLPALSGISRRYQQLTGEEYLAGIWKGSVSYGLGWYISSLQEAPEDAAETPLPSWSWASRHDDIDFTCAKIPQAEVMKAQMQPFGEDKLGQLARGDLWVRSYTKRAQVRTVDVNKGLGRRALLYENQYSERPIAQLRHDNYKVHNDASYTADITCLLLSIQGDADSADPNYTGYQYHLFWIALALQPSPERQGAFCRIGTVRRSSHEDQHLITGDESSQWIMSGSKETLHLV